MPRTWSTSGVDLHLDLSPTRRRGGVEAALREVVEGRHLPVGTRLPPTRALALDLGVARNTVVGAYARLVAEGLLVARQGSGTYVGAVDAAPAADGPARPRVTAAHDLRPGVPDLTSFPRDAWLSALRTAFTEAEPADFDYADPRGLPAVRAAVAAYLARSRGVRADPDLVVLTSGFTQALDVVAHALANRAVPGTRRRLGVEAHGHAEFTAIVKAQRLQPTWLAVDEAGADIASLSTECGVLLTPAHQFPIGSALSPDRRAAVVQWATEGDRVIIEDDYDGEFQYARLPLGVLQADAPEHVVYVGSVSKTLAPGVRLAWVVAPRRLLPDLLRAKTRRGMHTTCTDQLTFAAFVGAGHLDRHLRGRRTAYRRRRDHLVEALARRHPTADVLGEPAGLQTTVVLPDGVGARSVVAAARRRHLRVRSLDTFALDGTADDRALVVGFASPPSHAYPDAVARLVTAIDDAAGR